MNSNWIRVAKRMRSYFSNLEKSSIWMMTLISKWTSEPREVTRQAQLQIILKISSGMILNSWWEISPSVSWVLLSSMCKKVLMINWKRNKMSRIWSKVSFKASPRNKVTPWTRKIWVIVYTKNSKRLERLNSSRA